MPRGGPKTEPPLTGPIRLNLLSFGFMPAKATYSIGVDLGGTNLRAAAISQTGECLGRLSGSTDLTGGREAVIGDIVTSIRALRDQFGPSGFAGVGVAVPGFIRIKEGFIVGSNNLAELEGFAVRDDIRQRLGSPVILENDANAAALGEKWIGAGKDVDDLVLLTLGTGIGGGIVVNGEILHGSVGMAGELGHMTVSPFGNPCGCGNAGCVEKHASATAITSMASLLKLGVDLTAKDVYDMAQGGSPDAEKAKHIFRIMGESLGIVLANLVNIFNFPLYLLSGGVLAAWDLFAPSMLAEVKQRSFTFRNTDTRIEKAVLGSDAGLFGAAYLPLAAQKKRQS